VSNMFALGKLELLKLGPNMFMLGTLEKI
jgi:hypothetical protein